jgi:hypothetical protein
MQSLSMNTLSNHPWRYDENLCLSAMIPVFSNSCFAIFNFYPPPPPTLSLTVRYKDNLSIFLATQGICEKESHAEFRCYFHRREYIYLYNSVPAFYITALLLPASFSHIYHSSLAGTHSELSKDAGAYCQISIACAEGKYINRTLPIAVAVKLKT